MKELEDQKTRKSVLYVASMREDIQELENWKEYHKIKGNKKEKIGEDYNWMLVDEICNGDDKI